MVLLFGIFRPLCLNIVAVTDTDRGLQNARSDGGVLVTGGTQPASVSSSSSPSLSSFIPERDGLGKEGLLGWSAHQLNLNNYSPKTLSPNKACW